MTDVDKYLTKSVRRIAREQKSTSEALRTVLPVILARHRADVLQEAATEAHTYCARYGGCLSPMLRREAQQ